MGVRTDVMDNAGNMVVEDVEVTAYGKADDGSTPVTIRVNEAQREKVEGARAEGPMYLLIRPKE